MHVLVKLDDALSVDPGNVRAVTAAVRKLKWAVTVTGCDHLLVAVDSALRGELSSECSHLIGKGRQQLGSAECQPQSA